MLRKWPRPIFFVYSKLKKGNAADHVKTIRAQGKVQSTISHPCVTR